MFDIEVMLGLCSLVNYLLFQKNIYYNLLLFKRILTQISYTFLMT